LIQLDRTEKKTLLDLARRSVEAAVCGRYAPEPDTPPPDRLLEPAAAFVTLREAGQLRGCIGLLRFEVSLWDNVREAAAAAALDDPRFMPVREDELAALDLEISILDPPVPLPDPASFEPGRHGIVVSRGSCRGLLLPQVAPEMGWGRIEMLEGVCRKAGLAPDAWQKAGTRLYVFESACFDEAALSRHPGERAGTPGTV
jgi:AmmeMemoRadiSam system protein A